MALKRKRTGKQRRKEPRPSRQSKKRATNPPENVVDTELPYNVQGLIQARERFFAQSRMTNKDLILYEKSRQENIPFPVFSAQEMETMNPLAIHLAYVEPYMALHEDDLAAITRGYITYSEGLRRSQCRNTGIYELSTQASLPSLAAALPPPQPEPEPETLQTQSAYTATQLVSTSNQPPFAGNSEDRAEYTYERLPTPSTPTHPRPPLATRTLILPNGEIITYKDGDIRPPTVKKVYKNDLESLLHDWEYGSNKLVVHQGRPIPIREWRQIFQRSDRKYWKTYTKTYTEIKYYPSKDAFWDDFSYSGTHCNRHGERVWRRLPWKRLVEEVRKKRESIDEVSVLRAKEEHINDFDEVFSYRIGSDTKAFLSPRKIASKFRNLHGCNLPWDDDEGRQSDI